MSGNKKILSTAYPMTLYWKPYQDQNPFEISFDFSAYKRYPDQLASLLELSTPDLVPIPAIIEPAIA
jgi:hypothetical protein